MQNKLTLKKDIGIPIEVIWEILSFLKPKDIIQVCIVSKYLYKNTLKNNNFWRYFKDIFCEHIKYNRYLDDQMTQLEFHLARILNQRKRDNFAIEIKKRIYRIFLRFGNQNEEIGEQNQIIEEQNHFNQFITTLDTYNDVADVSFLKKSVAKFIYDKYEYEKKNDKEEVIPVSPEIPLSKLVSIIENIGCCIGSSTLCLISLSAPMLYSSFYFGIVLIPRVMDMYPQDKKNFGDFGIIFDIVADGVIGLMALGINLALFCIPCCMAGYLCLRVEVRNKFRAQVTKQLGEIDGFINYDEDIDESDELIEVDDSDDEEELDDNLGKKPKKSNGPLKELTNNGKAKSEEIIEIREEDNGSYDENSNTFFSNSAKNKSLVPSSSVVLEKGNDEIVISIDKKDMKESKQPDEHTSLLHADSSSTRKWCNIL